MADEEEIYLTSAQVRARYGNRSQMWIHRRLNNPASTFPRPHRLGGGRLRYWLLSELREWEKEKTKSEGSASTASGEANIYRRIAKSLAHKPYFDQLKEFP